MSYNIWEYIFKTKFSDEIFPMKHYKATLQYFHNSCPACAAQLLINICLLKLKLINININKN